MKSDFTGRWALSPSSLRREPFPAEISGGFPCGALDRALFNELMFRLTQAYGETAYCITESGQTPDQADLTQLWEAIGRRVGTHSPQRLAFDQYFSDVNPTVQANTDFDTDGDAGTMPAAAIQAYSYNYESAFPDEKTLINVVIASNAYVQRPGTTSVKAYVRAKATNAVGVNRNNFVTIDANYSVLAQDWKSIALSMLIGKEAGTTNNLLQLHCWWSEFVANVGSDPYRVFLDDCEMLIIERVVSAFPTFPYSD